MTAHATHIADLAMTVTDRQIRALLSEAGTAGDSLQCAICHIALEEWDTEEDDLDSDDRRALERLGIIPEHIGSDVAAQAECARVIAAAAAAATDD